MLGRHGNGEAGHRWTLASDRFPVPAPHHRWGSGRKPRGERSGFSAGAPPRSCGNFAKIALARFVAFGLFSPCFSPNWRGRDEHIPNGLAFRPLSLLVGFDRGRVVGAARCGEGVEAESTGARDPSAVGAAPVHLYDSFQSPLSIMRHDDGMGVADAGEKRQRRFEPTRPERCWERWL